MLRRSQKPTASSGAPGNLNQLGPICKMNKRIKVNTIIYLSLLLIGITTMVSFVISDNFQSWSYSTPIFFLAFAINCGCAVTLSIFSRQLTGKEKENVWKPHLSFLFSTISIYFLGYVTTWGGYLFFVIFPISLIVFAIIIVRSLMILVKSKT